MGDFQGHPFRGNQWTAGVSITNDVTGSHSGQLNGTLRAKDGAGNTVAYLDWVKYGDEVSISMVETAPEARGRGLATSLVERLLEENPGARLEWGMSTPEGWRLRQKMEATNPRIRAQVEEDKRKAEDADRRYKADAAEYRQLVESLKPEMSAEEKSRINDRLNEIDSRWGGDVDNPRVGEEPKPYGVTVSRGDYLAEGRPSVDPSILSPSGHVSDRAREAALERTRVELFGKRGLQPSVPAQPSNREALLRQARELRDLAARGMKPRSYLRKAEELERKAGGRG